jgi:hypothetical protein
MTNKRNSHSAISMNVESLAGSIARTAFAIHQYYTEGDEESWKRAFEHLNHQYTLLGNQIQKLHFSPKKG